MTNKINSEELAKMKREILELKSVLEKFQEASTQNGTQLDKLNLILDEQIPTFERQINNTVRLTSLNLILFAINLIGLAALLYQTIY